jgi:hypothetical protein
MTLWFGSPRLALGEIARLGVRPDFREPPAGGRGQYHVVLRDPADALVDDVDADLGVLDSPAADDRLDRALTPP